MNDVLYIGKQVARFKSAGLFMGKSLICKQTFRSVLSISNIPECQLFPELNFQLMRSNPNDGFLYVKIEFPRGS